MMRCKKIIACFMALAIMLSNLTVRAEMTYAAQNMTGNFNKNYSLNGSAQDKIVNVAAAQVGKTKAQLGYTEAWCADFVGDCAQLAGLSNYIPSDCNCYSMYNRVIKAGGTEVSSPQKGDLVFYVCKYCGWVHVGLMINSWQSIEGNYGGRVTQVNGHYSDGNHTTESGIVSKKYVRPAYAAATSAFGTPVDLGTDFYAYIINTYAWKHLTNDNPNVCIRKETGADNQIWKFTRQGDGSYKIISVKDGRALDDYNLGQTDGTNVAVYASNDSDAQKWFIYGTSGAYILRAKCGNLVLDVNGAGTADGTNVQMWTKNGGNAQKFQIWKLNRPGATTVRFSAGAGYTNTTFSWDKASNTKSYDLKIWKGKVWNGDAYKILWNLTGTSAQVQLPPGYYEAYVDSRNNGMITMSSNVVKFTVGNGTPANLGNDFYATILTVKNQLAFTNTNGNVDVRKQDGTTKQIWHFKRLSDGFYTIQNTADGKYLDTDNSKDANGTNIKVWTYNGSDAQKYYLFMRANGQYYMRPKCAARMVDVNGGKNNPGDNVQLWDFNGGDAQIFSINKTNNPTKTECTHKYGAWTVTKKATCTADGSQQRKCSVCGKTETQTIKATGHKYKNQVIAPTSTQKGYTQHTCTVCGYSYKDNYTNTTACTHKYGSWTVTKKATCTADGSQQRKCSVCGKTETQTIKATGHKYKNQVIAPTSTQKGYTQHTCTVCGYSYKDNYTNVVEKKETVSVTYDVNGGEMSQTVQSGTKGSTIKILTEQPVKYVTVTFDANGADTSPDDLVLMQEFVKWVSEASTGSASYKSGESVKLTGNMTLKAEYGSARLNTLPVVEKTGYSFEGWYTSSNVQAYAGMAISSNMVLTAQWTEEAQQTPDTDAGGSDDAWSNDDIWGSDDDSQYDMDDTEADDDYDAQPDELVVGDEFSTDDAIYTVLSLGDKNCVEYSELFDDDEVNVIVPDTLVIDGTTYKVTAIGEKAFYKNTTVKQVTIGSNVKKIGAKAFYGCTSLKKLSIMTSKIKSGAIGKQAFKKTNKKVKVYIPQSTYKSYKKMLKKAGVSSKCKLYKIAGI